MKRLGVGSSQMTVSRVGDKEKKWLARGVSSVESEELAVGAGEER